MPRMQVYLPDHLCRAVKEGGMGASKLSQETVQVEMKRRRLLGEADRFLAELIAEVGEPTPEETARRRGSLADSPEQPL